MKSVRRGVFETNSSSTHSLTICSDEDFQKFKKGEVMLKTYPEEHFVTREEAIKELKDKNYFDVEDESDEDQVNECLRDNECLSYTDWSEDDELETFMKTYTTKGGEKVVAFGKYGYQ